MEDERIILDWRDVNHESGRWADRWDYNLALYIILHPNEDEVLYLGKADDCTVMSRWNADDKRERVWRRIEDERGLFEHGFIVGEFRLPDGQRLSRQLVCERREPPHPPDQALGKQSQRQVPRPLFTARHGGLLPGTVATTAEDLS